MVLEEVALVLGAVGSIVVVFGLANFYFKEAIRKAQKTQVLEQLFKQLNIKDFKVTDLNSDKLDDRGFLRLMTMLSSLYQQKQTAGYDFSKIAQMQQEVNSFIGSLRQMGGVQTQPQGQIQP